MQVRARAVVVCSLLLPLTGCPDPEVPADTTDGGTADSGSTGAPGSESTSSSGVADETIGDATQGGSEDTSSTTCGNGVVDGDEECDDGAESASCNADCTEARCGDSIVNAAAGETCDEGAQTATCNEDCTVAACGDGLLNTDAGEECDEGGETATCDDDCTAVACGDANSNEAAGEECDDGRETLGCDVDCTGSMCGDGVFNMSAGEECDDMGKSAACDVDCTAASCGDGDLNMAAGEECDHAGESLLCNVDCTNSACGDGVHNMTAGEECDTMGDSMSCDADCTLALCGDLNVNVVAGEQCDGTNFGGQTCQLQGFDNGSLACDAGCALDTSGCYSCGDGVIDPTENCEGADLGGQTCMSLGFDGGTLACNAGCGFDTSACIGQCPSFIAASLDADITAAAPTLEQTRMTAAWDGMSLWTSSGGGGAGIRLVEHDAGGVFVADYAPGLDLRSVFTQGDGTAPLYARVIASPVIRVQTAPGVFMNDVTLVGGSIDSQASVAWHALDDRFIAHDNGTIDRWDAMGNYTESVTLIGYGIGNESSYPQDRGVAFGLGCYLTIDDGVLSSWDPAGNRIDTIVLNQAIPGNFDHNFSVSFAQGRAWHGTNPDWHGYDVFGIAP